MNVLKLGGNSGSAVFRNFFEGGGKIKVSRNKGGKPNWMQNIQSDLVFHRGGGGGRAQI